MGQLYVADWKFGMDRRRKRVAGTIGTLWDAKNVVINRGGDIERAKRFVPIYTMPAGRTFGLGSVRGQVYVFGSLAASQVVVPTGVQYQQLAAPSGAAMTQVLDARTAGGSLYVIAQYADGNTFHFYNGARITDWDAVADANTDFPTLASYMADVINADAAVTANATGSTITITALDAGTPFTISKATTDFGGTANQDLVLTTVQANVPTVAEARATTQVRVFSGTAGSVRNITINGVSLMSAAVIYTTDNATTLAAVAVQINDKASTHGYTAVAVADVLTITAAVGTGATPNDYAVVGVVSGGITLDTPSMSGGVAATAGVAQVVTAEFTGTFESTDQFRLNINGTLYSATGRAAGTGTSAYVVKRRVFSPAASLWEYCKLNTFNNWNDSNASSGSGFLNISNEAEGSERLIGAGTYIQQSAVFSRRNIRVYNVDTDATKILLSQPIDNSGSLAARAILGYGTTDLFYLDEPGIRSLRARDASGEPFVNDIGVPIDPFVRDHLDSLTTSVVQRACSVVEPRDGRFWLALGSRIYALSYFPGSQISAWTYLEPGFVISDFARAYNQLYVRGGDTIYLYGGQSGTTYPNANETVAQVDLPFVSGSPPGVAMMLGFDMAAEGEWLVKALVDPTNEDIYQTIGTVDGITYSDSDIMFPGRTTHVAFSMTCSGAGSAKIANLTVHTDGKEPNA